MFVYMIICDKDISPVTGTGKYYVGKTIEANLQTYLKDTFAAAQRGKTNKPYLFNAMRKYPILSDWRIAPLMSTLPSDKDIKQWEKEIISLFRCQDHRVGFNISDGGSGGATIGHAVSQATREAIGKASRKKKGTPNPKLSVALRGNKRALGTKHPEMAARNSDPVFRAANSLRMVGNARGMGARHSQSWSAARRAAYEAQKGGQ
jgi:hypothetical protein